FDKVLKICQIRDKLRREHLKEALAKQKKTFHETNIVQQAQNTDLENEEFFDIENEIFNTSEDMDIEELNKSNSEDEFKNCTGDIQSIENWRYLES
ncbi:24163_t:CDS:1, partial [Gigaspora margarita]